MIDFRLNFAGICLLCCWVGLVPVTAQTVDDRVDEYVRKMSEGRYGEIRKESDGAVKVGRPNDPGMIFLEGLIAPDGTTSIRLFMLVADSLGARSGRADALARMAEIYSRLDNRREASENHRTLRAGHPAATYVTTGYIDNTTIREAADGLPDSTGRIVAVYAIQVGAFKVFENAVKLTELLKSKGFNAVIYDNLIDGKNLLHLVWVGRFDQAGDAKPEMKKIEELTGIKGVLREQMIWRRW